MVIKYFLIIHNKLDIVKNDTIIMLLVLNQFKLRNKISKTSNQLVRNPTLIFLLKRYIKRSLNQIKNESALIITLINEEGKFIEIILKKIIILKNYIQNCLMKHEVK